MKMYSSHWDEKNGSCTLHGIPQLPCPACMNERHKDITYTLDEIDRMMIEDGEVTLEDLFPAGFLQKPFMKGQRVRDLKYPNRSGGIVRAVSPHEILVDMTFEDGHVGLSSFKPSSAEAELEVV
jgi:hypothetical protein